MKHSILTSNDWLHKINHFIFNKETSQFLAYFLEVNSVECADEVPMRADISSSKESESSLPRGLDPLTLEEKEFRGDETTGDVFPVFNPVNGGSFIFS
jgi:hypothetical protein